ncbi:4-amino-4-deoxy-L-arabinose transferase [Synechococcus sp. RSCCF101]|uniref:4-amino-4-deoxy-L-arabinose transferase n=1 Tax=Synechococcus sp. RSCCF101 TaxID=2511069 RepID=UPI00351A22E9
MNAGVMAAAGDHPSQAAWSLSLWNALLLVVVAGWSRALAGRAFALLATALVALTPALLALRSDYVLEIPLTALVVLALWRLGAWWSPLSGGRWHQALPAAAAVAAALLVKQSALLPLLPALLWSCTAAARRPAGRRQIAAGLLLVLAALVPWLHHNWITTLGGTNRAVIESAAREGDPSLLSLESWLWYARLLPEQVGVSMLLVGLAGLIGLGLIRWRRSGLEGVLGRLCAVVPDRDSPWWWLLGCLAGGWLLTTLSPNKSDRYIAPLLPLVVILLARGWWAWGPPLRRLGRPLPVLALAAALLASAWTGLRNQLVRLEDRPRGPLEAIVAAAGGADPQRPPRTLIVVPSTPDLNQHNVSYFGRRSGGRLVGRQLGSHQGEIAPALERSTWLVLAEGDQGSVSEAALELSRAVRESGLFELQGRWPRPEGGAYELWHRRDEAPDPPVFAERFRGLAAGMAAGPAGLEPVFAEVAVEHMVDGHRTYREAVRESARARLERDPADRDALWQLALLAVLDNRPTAAGAAFARLEAIERTSPWPSAYGAVVALADWNPWRALATADRGSRQAPDEPVLRGLRELSAVLSGRLWRLPQARRAIPEAAASVERALAGETDPQPAARPTQAAGQASS